MELKDFVKKALVDIVTGISEAQHELADSGAIINPSAMDIDNNGIKTIRPNGNPKGRLLQKVEMNIAVTSSKSGGGALLIQVIGLEGKVTSEKVSSIKFNIPVSFPVMETEYEPKKAFGGT
jgi:hypothetical protein